MEAGQIGIRLVFGDHIVSIFLMRTVTNLSLVSRSQEMTLLDPKLGEHSAPEDMDSDLCGIHHGLWLLNVILVTNQWETNLHQNYMFW